MYVTLLLVVMSLKSTTLLLASSREVGVKATAGMVDALSVEIVSAGFFEVQAVKSKVDVRAIIGKIILMILFCK